MFGANKSRRYWIRSIALSLASVIVVFFAAKWLVYSSPKSLQSYLKFLNRSTDRAEVVNIYSQEEFGDKYLNLNGTSNHSLNEIYSMIQNDFSHISYKENRFFKVYQVSSRDDKCIIYTFGINKRFGWAYVTTKNICLSGDDQDK